jgi:hypothetical protein
MCQKIMLNYAKIYKSYKHVKIKLLICKYLQTKKVYAKSRHVNLFTYIIIFSKIIPGAMKLQNLTWFDDTLMMYPLRHVNFCPFFNYFSKMTTSNGTLKIDLIWRKHLSFDLYFVCKINIKRWMINKTCLDSCKCVQNRNISKSYKCILSHVQNMMNIQKLCKCVNFLYYLII